MKGLLTITRRVSERFLYFGFNGGFGVELWKNLEEWNFQNENENITIPENEDFCALQHLPVVQRYVQFVTPQLTSNEAVYSIIVDTDLTDTFYLDDFQMIGYDCGYLYGKGFSLLFSCIPNELIKKESFTLRKEFMPFLAKLNSYGLFEHLEDALTFENLRQELISKGDIAGMETAFSNFSIVRVFLFNYTNPFFNPKTI